MGKRVALLSAATLLAVTAVGVFLVAPEETRAQTQQYLSAHLQQAQAHFSSMSKTAHGRFDELVSVTKLHALQLYNDVLVPNLEAASIQVNQTTSQVQTYLLQVYDDTLVPNFNRGSVKLSRAIAGIYPVFQGLRESDRAKALESVVRKWAENAATTAQKWYSTSSTKEQALGASILLGMVALVVFSRRRRSKSLVTMVPPVAPAVPAPEMKVAAPLAERSTTRRRRTDSPAPRSENNENARPMADTNSDLLYRLNTSTKEELDNVNGLGEKSIQMLLKYRGQQGELHSFDDLVTKVGLRPAVFANFRKAQEL